MTDLLLLLADIVDHEDCWFDHHGECQAHPFLSLEPHGICPMAKAKQVLDDAGIDWR